MNVGTKSIRRTHAGLFAAIIFAIALTLAFPATTTPGMAATFEGTKTIYLVDASDNEHAIGSVTFSGEDAAASIDVKIDDSRFVEKFLSMRPFRCIDGTKQTVCHLPYPYDLKNKITGDDLTDLEYRLLFLHKGPGDYGIDAWNGLYYKLEVAADGSLNGALQEADFNVLAVPPDEPFSRPIGAADLTPAEQGSHRFSRLIIK